MSSSSSSSRLTAAKPATAKRGRSTSSTLEGTYNFQDFSQDVGNKLWIPGTWWSGGTPSDRRRDWEAVVVKYEKKHRFPSGAIKEAVLLSCPEYQVTDDAEREFWCECRGVGKKTYASLKAAWEKKEKERNVREAAAKIVATARENKASTDADDCDADDDASGDDAQSKQARYKSNAKPFFEVVKGPTPCKGTGGAVSTKHVRFEMRCILPGGSKLPTVVQQSEIKGGKPPTEPTSTGKLTQFLKKHYPIVHREFIEGKSPYSRSRVVDGEVVRKLTLKETWESCVLYVLACASELRPFRLGKGGRMKAFLQSLEPGFDVPCRSTCNRIALALVQYNDELMRNYLEEVKAERMDGFIATTEDGWTDGKGKKHYSSTSISMITRRLEKKTVDIHSLTTEDIASGSLIVNSGERVVLQNAQLVISFEVSSSTDKAHQVAENYESKLHPIGLNTRNVSLSTLDGAAVGLASRRHLEKDIEGWTVCGPHDTARACLWALGIGTKESKNPGAKELLKKNRAMASFFHRSTKWTNQLMKAQVKKSVPKGKELSAAVGGVTRWSADYETVKRNNILQECIDDVLEDARHPTRTGPTRPLVASWDDDCDRDDLPFEVAEVLSDQYETASTEGESDRPSAGSTTTRTTTGTPEPLTEAEWNANAQLEAAMRPVHILTQQTEGDVPVADMFLYYVKRAVKTLQKDTLNVPRRKTGLTSTRRFDEISWEACDPAVTTFRDVVIEELQRRHLRKAPPKAIMILMSLNPSLQLERILPEAQRRLTTVIFEAAWQEAAENLKALQPEPALPSPHKRRKAHDDDDDDDDDSMLDVTDDRPSEPGATASRGEMDSNVQLAKFKSLPKAKWSKFIIDDGIRGKRLDMAAMYAHGEIRAEFPIATMLYESKGSAQVTEAHEERVFRFAKLTKTPQRASLSPVLLTAFVIIKHNFPVWEMLFGKIDFDRVFELFKTTLNTTGEHDNPGGETDEDDEESGGEEDDGVDAA